MLLTYRIQILCRISAPVAVCFWFVSDIPGLHLRSCKELMTMLGLTPDMVFYDCFFRPGHRHRAPRSRNWCHVASWRLKVFFVLFVFIRGKIFLEMWAHGLMAQLPLVQCDPLKIVSWKIYDYRECREYIKVRSDKLKKQEAIHPQIR